MKALGGKISPDEITKPCPKCKKPILVEYEMCIACEMDAEGGIKNVLRKEQALGTVEDIDFFGGDE